MVYKCAVKHNGILYPAGAEVPADNKKVPETNNTVEVKGIEQPKKSGRPKKTDAE